MFDEWNAVTFEALGDCVSERGRSLGRKRGVEETADVEGQSLCGGKCGKVFFAAAVAFETFVVKQQ